MDFITPILQLGADIYQNERNIKFQKDINQSNLDYANQQNEITRQREDNAYQRQVTDLEAAGLSPLLASGGAQVSNPVNYNAAAPQMDLSGMIGAMSNLQMLQLEKDKLEESKRVHNDEIGIKRDEVSMHHEEFIRDLENRKDEFSKQIALENKKLLSAYETQTREDLKSASDTSVEYHKLLSDKYETFIPVDECDVYSDYYKKLQSWNQSYLALLDKADYAPTKDSYTDSDSKTVKGEFGSTVGSDLVGAKVKGSVGSTDISGGVHQEDEGASYTAQVARFFKNNPMPVYYYSPYKYKGSN